MRFIPKHVEVTPGTTVRWINTGGAPNHTTTSKDGRWDSGFVFPNTGDSFDVTFGPGDNDRLFEYLCQSHSDDGMKASIRVGAGAPQPSTGY